MNKNIKTINNLEKNLDNTRYLLAKLAKDKTITFEQHSTLLDSTLPIQNVINTLRQEEENGGQANA